MAQAIEETIATKSAAGRREVYIRGLESYLTAFANGRGEKQVSEITPFDIERWFESRHEALKTMLGNIGRLSSLFELYWRRRYVSENPCRRIEKPSIETETPSILNNRQCVRALLWTLRNRPHFLA
jgi:site-specific recombinase XerD